VYFPPDADRVRVPVLADRLPVVRRVVGAFVALAVVLVVTRFVGFFVGALVAADVRMRVVFAGAFVCIVSLGIAPLLCTFTSHPR